jgi:formylglycine-generating enzyme
MKRLMLFVLLSVNPHALSQNMVWSVDKVLDNAFGNSYQVRQLDATNGFHIMWASELAYLCGLDIGDADNDGQDELVSCSDHQICVYELNGDTPKIIEIPYSKFIGNILVRDADNDSMNEIAVHYIPMPPEIDGRTYIYKYGQGAYELKASFRNLGYCQRLEIADADNDTKNELIYGTWDSISVRSYDAATNQITSKYRIASSEINDQVIAADVDNDGLNEIVSGGNFGAARIWEFQNGTFTLAGVQSVPGASQAVQVGDVNADSQNELVVGTAGEGGANILIYSFSGGVFSEQWRDSLEFGVDVGGLEIGDADNDGRNELAAWEGIGATSFRVVKFVQNSYVTLASDIPSRYILIGGFDLSNHWKPLIVQGASNVIAQDTIVIVKSLQVRNFGAGVNQFGGTLSVKDTNVATVQGTVSFPVLGYGEEGISDSTTRCIITFKSRPRPNVMQVAVEFIAGGALIGSGSLSIGTISPELVEVTGGTFPMGGTSGDRDEQPIHSVTVGTFSVDKFEVTYEMWREVYSWGLTHSYTDLAAGENGYYPSSTNNPVTMVTWYDVLKWCNARSEKDGLTPVFYLDNTLAVVYRTGELDLAADAVKWTANGYRLPTEAEWEFAARGGTHSRGYTYSGSNSTDTVAWGSITSGGNTHPVATRGANELGLYDMSGNVWEWCWDWYGATYYSVSPPLDPKGPSSGTWRVIRGGSCRDSDYKCRVAYRNAWYATYNMMDVGFRCVQTTAIVGMTGRSDRVIPLTFSLDQNYPNPFNPSTTIRYAVPVRSHVTLTIFNTIGQQVATLVQGEQEAGYHEVRFEASGLASGVYLYRMQAGDFVQTRKLVLLQ